MNDINREFAQALQAITNLQVCLARKVRGVEDGEYPPLSDPILKHYRHIISLKADDLVVLLARVEGKVSG